MTIYIQKIWLFCNSEGSIGGNDAKDENLKDEICDPIADLDYACDICRLRLLSIITPLQLQLRNIEQLTLK